MTNRLARACAARMDEKDAALSQGYSPDYWSKVKAGEKNARLDPIADLPVDVQREFIAAWARDLGMTVSIEDPQRAALARLAHAAVDVLSFVEPKMAKASL